MTRTITASRTHIDDLPGLWRRSLFVAPDGARDVTTHVAWLQGPRCYIDLRQPLAETPYDGVRCLRDLDAAQVEALAAQDGFAGVLVQQGDVFEWQRDIDFQPRSAVADRGRLDDRGDVMIEYGHDADYVEHWHRDTKPGAPVAALALQDRTSGVRGMIVRAGDRFMIARGRARALDAGRPLVESVRTARSLEEAQNFVDCEISLGCVDAAWRIERSSLPFRVGRDLRPTRDGDLLRTADITPQGLPFERTWLTLHREGDLF